MMDHREVLTALIAGQDLSAIQCQYATRSILEEQWDSSAVGAYLGLLQQKGATGIELATMVEELRARSVPVTANSPFLVDTCGTGGGPSTLNISTAAAIVAASAGATVAKHGNRAVTSQCGSADVLEALGVKLSVTPLHAETMLETAGIAFLFAPAFHPILAVVGPIRRALGVRTVFNQLGPLLNPASAKRQVIGVYEHRLLKPTADALVALGVEHAWVVCSDEGLDEISPGATTQVIEVRESAVQAFQVSPSDWGQPSISLSEIRPMDSAKENADALREALSRPASSFGRAIIPNAGAALFVAGKAESFAGACELARSAMESGAATEKLEHWKQASEAQ